MVEYCKKQRQIRFVRHRSATSSGEYSDLDIEDTVGREKAYKAIQDFRDTLWRKRWEQKQRDIDKL
jgi:hypothetical protein